MIQSIIATTAADDVPGNRSTPPKHIICCSKRPPYSRGSPQLLLLLLLALTLSLTMTLLFTLPCTQVLNSQLPNDDDDEEDASGRARRDTEAELCLREERILRMSPSPSSSPPLVATGVVGGGGSIRIGD